MNVLRDTSAWHVIEQILGHVFGLDDLSDDEIVAVCHMFWKAGGTWEELMDGDVKHVGILEECIGNIVEARRLKKVARKMIGNV